MWFSIKNVKYLIVMSFFIVSGCDKSSDTASEKSLKSEQSKAAVMALADEYLASVLAINPFLAYVANYELDHNDGSLDNSLSALNEWHVLEDSFLKQLLAINYQALKGTDEAILYAQLQEELEASVGKRICKTELWNVNHMWSFHINLVSVAKEQPVGTETLRKEALVRWGTIGNYFYTEIENLKKGLAQGYSAPKVVVNRVISQLDGLITAPVDKSPLYNPITRDDDAIFQADFKKAIQYNLIPALKAYRQFLQSEYLSQARESRAIAVNPNGIACYEALYRGYTSLKWSAQKVHDIGAEKVAQYKNDVIKLGTELYQLDDMGAILQRVNDDPANRFETVEEMHGFFEKVVERVLAASSSFFSTMPKTKLDIVPYPDYLIGTGMSGSYEQGGPDRNGIFRYDPSLLESQKKGGAEVLSVHEGYPGHHMQIALVQDQAETHPVQRIFNNSAFVEGWARYAENLTEEFGLYETDFAKITRRAWPARGMVTDTGLHVLDWTAERTHAFLAESGNFNDEAGMALLDRMAAIPAQLTSYDSGALELFALRNEAKEALGDKFDLKTFHTIILKNGVVPLWLLREQVEEWIASEQ